MQLRQTFQELLFQCLALLFGEKVVNIGNIIYNRDKHFIRAPTWIKKQQNVRVLLRRVGYLIRAPT